MREYTLCEEKRTAPAIGSHTGAAEGQGEGFACPITIAPDITERKPVSGRSPGGNEAYLNIGRLPVTRATALREP
jgi:hypothetical protein